MKLVLIALAMSVLSLVSSVAAPVVFNPPAAIVEALPDANEGGGGGGGYSQLPPCSARYVGVTLYVQGHYWYCSLAGSRATPPYWSFVR